MHTDEKRRVKRRDRHVEEIRHLLSGECVVALDTNILSALEKEPEPCWYRQFMEMSKAGVKFSIPEVCIGEHLECYNNPINDIREKWGNMVSKLNAIIWHEFPCLPMRGALYELVGIQQNDDESDCCCDQFTCVTSRELYEYFINYDSSPYNKPECRARFENEVEKACCYWKELIASLRKDGIWETEQLSNCLMRCLTEEQTARLSAQGAAQLELVEKLKTIQKKQLCDSLLRDWRRHFSSVDIVDRLALPFCFAIEHASDLDYDSSAKHCRYRGHRIEPRNDGVDYQILLLTMPSINICSYDGFFQRAHDLELKKSCSCYTPDSLCGEWVSDKKVLLDKLLRVDVPMD